MRALEIITGHVIYNPAYTYEFQLKTTQAMVSDLKNWREKYPLKPLMVTEYGADTISGE